MELAIHILLLITMLACGVCLFIVVKIVSDLEAVLGKMNRRIATMEHNNNALVSMFRVNNIKVVEKDEAPLDFPNDRKE